MKKNMPISNREARHLQFHERVINVYGIYYMPKNVDRNKLVPGL